MTGLGWIVNPEVFLSGQSRMVFGRPREEEEKWRCRLAVTRSSAPPRPQAAREKALWRVDTPLT